MYNPDTAQTTPEQTASSQPVSEAYRKLMANPIISKLPQHLKQFIVDQNYIAYTWQDHSVWRYVLRQNRRFLIEYAHRIYFEGLEKTGLKIEAVPSIIEMNDILSKIGWAAATVDGFIPPAAFMEFQAHRVLVIASDMRQINHVEYTPSPDITHEAAGHAPVIADPTYAEYLRRLGEIGAKAMSSRKDYELYEAIRRLSLLKEQRDADPTEVSEAEKDVLYKQDNLGEPSEMALLSRLHWWTVEYGLIGTLDNPKIYGAGLLSSIGEAAHCFTNEVKKLPYSIEAKDYPFDITTMQPQLFVTTDFDYLIEVLENFASTMAYRRGGMSGIKKAIDCKNTSSCQWSSGLQVSGTFTEVIQDDNGTPIYLKTAGKTNLAFDYSELPGHGIDTHTDGFGSPVGSWRDTDKPPHELSDHDLKQLHISPGKNCRIECVGGVIVEGILEKATRKDGKLILLSFSQCLVTYKDRVLFEPSWGIYDMAVGDQIVSVFAGAADKDAYQQPSAVSRRRTVKHQYSDVQQALFELYKQIRDFRENRSEDSSLLKRVWSGLRNDHPDEWLLPLEILELLSAKSLYPELQTEIRAFLELKAANRKELNKLIDDGLYLVDHPEAIK